MQFCHVQFLRTQKSMEPVSNSTQWYLHKPGRSRKPKSFQDEKNPASFPKRRKLHTSQCTFLGNFEAKLVFHSGNLQFPTHLGSLRGDLPGFPVFGLGSGSSSFGRGWPMSELPGMGGRGAPSTPLGTDSGWENEVAAFEVFFRGGSRRSSVKPSR